MIKEIIIRVEFNTAKEKITFNVPFCSKYLKHYHEEDKHIADFAIRPPADTIYFTDKAVEALLMEFDEKTKGYEILEVISIV